MTEKTKAKCLKCGYEWETRSELIKVSCPSCGDKVRINEINVGFDSLKNKTVGEVKELSKQAGIGGQHK